LKHRLHSPHPHGVNLSHRVIIKARAYRQ
jgi:hypothetical protein